MLNAKSMADAMPDLFILGGKTRLGQAVFSEAMRQGRSTRVLCSSPSERTGLLALFPSDAVVDSLPTPGTPSICIIVCAFGLAHPVLPALAQHLRRFEESADVMSSTAARAPGDVHVVLVSTVVALAPSRDRAYYAGFKNLAEAAVADAFRGLASARLSVVYPGHLSASPSASLAGRLATPYAALARLLLKMSGSSTAASRVVGLDARLWLFTRMLFLLACALAPGWRSVPISQRDGLPRH